MSQYKFQKDPNKKMDYKREITLMAPQCISKGAEPRRRYELSDATSLLSPRQLLSVKP